jgi:hypothetical protein
MSQLPVEDNCLSRSRNQYNFSSIKNFQPKKYTMKKLIVFLGLFVALGAGAANPPEVSEKVLKAFGETFVKATDVVWHEMENTYEARFKQSEIVTRRLAHQYFYKAQKEVFRQINLWCNRICN